MFLLEGRKYLEYQGDTYSSYRIFQLEKAPKQLSHEYQSESGRTNLVVQFIH